MDKFYRIRYFTTLHLLISPNDYMYLFENPLDDSVFVFII